MICKEQGTPGKVRIRFSLPAAIWADTICLVGDFNNWDSTITPLKLDDTAWSVTLELEAGQFYHYRYLVNGTEWMNDWRPDHHAPVERDMDDSVVVALLPHDMPQPEVGRGYGQQETAWRVLPGTSVIRRVV